MSDTVEVPRELVDELREIVRIMPGATDLRFNLPRVYSSLRRIIEAADAIHAPGCGVLIYGPNFACRCHD